jgi:hypothetical protein
MFHPQSHRIESAAETAYDSPSPGGRELEGGGFDPRLDPPLPGERDSMLSHATTTNRLRG